MTADELADLCRTHGITVSLANMIRENDAAALLDFSIRTLRSWRECGEGPPCVRMGGSWRYPLDGLAEFMTPAESGRTRQKAEVCDIDSAATEKHHETSFPKRLAR